MKPFKFVLFLLLMLLLWMPLAQQYTGYFTEPTLNGAFVLPTKPIFSVDSVKTFQYQKHLENYLNYNFGFRGLFVKIKNSFEYLFWKEIPVEDNIEGLDGYIFSKGSINRSIGVDYNGKETNKKTIERIRFLKDGLEKHGAHLVVVMAPSKECVFSEKIPSVYYNQFKSRNDYMDLIDGYKNSNIPYIDFCSYFRKINDTSRYALFTKTGFHWSTYGASVAHDSLIQFLTKYISKPMPSYVREGVEWSDTARLSDNDFESPMNLLFKLDSKPYVYPKLKIVESSRKNFRPKVIIIGDSFFWQLKNQKMMMNIFTDDSKFWFYFATTSFPIGDVAGVPLKNIDIMQELQNADLVLLFSSMGTLKTFPFGVTDYYYDNVSSASVLESLKDYIQTQPNWLKNLGKLSVTSKKTLAEIITNEAKQICRDKIFFNLKAVNNKYISTDRNLKNELIADRDHAWAWETFSLYTLENNQCIIRADVGNYLSIDTRNKNKIVATTNGIKAEEIFTLIKLKNNAIALKASNGRYLSFDSKSLQLFANSNSIGVSEKFVLTNQ